MTKILVVEDEFIVARELRQQLSQLGYDPVGHAVKGEDAIRMVAELRPDLVLMDIALAGTMDGVTAAENVRQEFDTPVVFLTAFAADEMLARAKLTEPFGFLLKPYSERELRTVLEMALHLHKLRQSRRIAESRYATLIESLSVGVVSLGLDGKIQSCNTAAQRILGLTRDQLLELSSLDAEWQAVQRDGNLFPADAHPASLVLKTGVAQHNVVMGVRKRDQSLAWLEVNAAPLSSEGQSVHSGVVVSFMDITVRISSEEQLKFRAQLLDAVGDAVVATDLTGTVNYWNRAAEHLYGWTAEEALGRNVMVLIVPNVSALQAQEIMGQLQQGLGWSGQFEVQDKNGRVFLARIRDTPVMGPGGDLVGIIGVSSEVLNGASKQT